MVIRLFWRYTHPAPQLPDTMSPTMKTLAHTGHLLLYVILVALPVTGCLFSWSAGHPARFYIYLKFHAWCKITLSY